VKRPPGLSRLYAKHPRADGEYDMDHSAVIYVMDPRALRRNLHPGAPLKHRRTAAKAAVVTKPAPQISKETPADKPSPALRERYAADVNPLLVRQLSALERDARID